MSDHGDAVGQDRAIDAILQVVVIVTHMELARPVLNHAGRLQDDLVELLVIAAGQGLDRGTGDRVARGPE